MDFETSDMEVKNITIVLERILPSLAKNLYGDDWRISIRELLQNCHDAIAELGFRGVASTEPPKIDIIPDPAAGTLTFRDNGIGMTHAEVEKYLATIGASGKREEVERLVRAGKLDRSALDSIIGQYGIGFLASFIIADKVEVLTRSRIDPGAGGVRAVFTGETRWYSTADFSANPGTEFKLMLKKERITDPATGATSSVLEFLNFERLKAEVRRFGDLLPYPIFVHREPLDVEGDLSNSVKGPWETNQFNVPGFVDYLKTRHPNENEPISPVAFAFDRATKQVTAHGLLSFPRKGRNAGSSDESVARVELLCRRMFITNDITTLLPDWATFVEVLVECPDLTPTLDRNNVIRHDPAFVALKQALGNKIIETLKYLASKQPKTFAELRSEHRERIYSSLYSDFQDAPDGKETFFRAIIDLIPFTVIHRSAPQGEEMTLRQYRDAVKRRQEGKNLESPKDRVYYLHDPSSTGQYRAMIIQRDLPVILATHPAEPLLLKAYGHVFGSEVNVQDVREILDLYVEQVDQTPYEAVKQFLSSLTEGGPDEVNAVKFEPSYVPAILTVRSAADPAQAAMLERLLAEGGSVLIGNVRRAIETALLSAKDGRSSVAVVLNDNNHLVRAIRDYCAQGKPLTGVVGDVLHEIYHNARIYADPVTAENAHFFEHRNAILGRLLEVEQSLVEARNDRDQLRIALKDRQLAQVPDGMGPRECALLLTDLRGSTRMVGFLDQAEGAEILQQYAEEVNRIVEKHEGKVREFTGDGVFAHFGLETGRPDTAAQRAKDCAFDIHGFTAAFFAQGKVANALQNSGGITIEGSRTVLHWARVMYGQIAGAPALVGRQVVALFRACERDELFTKCSIILTGPFTYKLHLPVPLDPLERDFRLDESLPAMTFYPHPAFAHKESG